MSANTDFSTPDPEAPPELTLLAMNLSGRFAGKEIRRFGNAVIGTLLIEKNADLLFGQQANFKAKFPEYYEIIGNPRAFLTYNKTRVKALDAKQFRHKIRDLQFAGKLPFHYLPLQNFTMTKFKTRKTPHIEFIAVSWQSEETHGRLKNTQMLKKLMSFVEKVALIEELPVIIGGSFYIPIEDAADCLPDGYCCYGYIPENARRSIRFADFFICPVSMRLENVKPIICANLELEEVPDMWLNPEDAFYCDPVRATLVKDRQSNDQKMHADKYIEKDDMDTYKRHEPDGEGSVNTVEERVENYKQYGLLKKLPSCPELYDDASENGTTCYMS